MATSTAAASSATVRYAPEDPSLPKPWRGLVDCELGYHYFWNPETNATQFERPLASSSTNPAPSNNAMGSSFLNVHKSHDDGRYSNDGSTKFTRDPSSATGHYALGDPSLPKPWIRLVDGETGFHYFWNPWMNVTQYERPLASSSTSPAPSNNALGS